MKNLLFLLSLPLASCATDGRIPAGTALTVGGKNPVAVAVGGKTWRDAFRAVGITVAQAAGQALVSAAVTRLESVDSGK